MKYVKWIFIGWVACLQPVIANAQDDRSEGNKPVGYTVTDFQPTVEKQSQSSFFTPGKSWILKDYDPFMPELEPVYSKVSVVGDTIVGNIQAKRLCSEGLHGEHGKYYMAAYEKDGVIYAYLNETIDGASGFYPMVDFNFKVGDYLTEYTAVVREDWVTIAGIKRRVLTLQNIYDKQAEPEYWIEGIGSTTDLVYMTPYPIPVGHRTDLIQCFNGEDCIFSASDFGRPDGIGEIISDGNRNEPLYDLMGRRVQNPRKGHIYIQSFKKVLWGAALGD